MQRSAFITVTGWLLAVVGGLGACYCLLFLFLPQQQLLDVVKQQQAAMPQDLPALDPAVLVSIMRGVMFGAFVLFLWGALSGVGLTRRKAWARLSCLVMLVLGAMVGLLYLLIGLAAGSMPAVAAAGQGRLGAMVIVGGVFAALCAFAAYQLSSAKVKQEFTPPKT